MKKHHRQKTQHTQAALSGTTAPSAPKHRKIPHQEILAQSAGYQDFLATYQKKIVPQRTRTIRLLGRKNSTRILTTLLGYEVQASYKRIQCPDLVTARYLRLFSELGFRTIQLPYDPTLTAKLIPEFEATIEGIQRQISERFPENAHVQNYVTRKVYEIIRRQLRGKSDTSTTGSLSSHKSEDQSKSSRQTDQYRNSLRNT
jgi:hypothetical protein